MTHFTTTVSRGLRSVYANYTHVETDQRPSCWAMGGIRCSHIDGRCNQHSLPYDDSWENEKKHIERLLIDE